MCLRDREYFKSQLCVHVYILLALVRRTETHHRLFEHVNKQQ